jgi:hypothetical protein
MTAENAIAHLAPLNLRGDADVSSILVPAWDQAARVHDWRNYVPDGIRDCWGQLSPDARIIAYAFAQLLADDEDWD